MKITQNFFGKPPTLGGIVLYINTQQKLGRKFLRRHPFFFQPSRDLEKICQSDGFLLEDKRMIFDKF